ncbi:hypothetical protein RIF29_40714 [Crotalaria pallida]|uniref:Uncharacterized protein n=1 Tax=Crotalaria pallida TaxID=3830 RepID=A0AAN9E551_CROPI
MLRDGLGITELVKCTHCRVFVMLKCEFFICVTENTMVYFFQPSRYASNITLSLSLSLSENQQSFFQFNSISKKMASFTKSSSSSSSLGRSSNPNSRSSELSDPMRRSFNGSPFSKPSVIPNSSRTFVPTTPANTPTDSHRRNSVGGGREVSFFRDLEDKENGKDQILKSSKARSPAAVSSKSAKNFMAPTISAASKVIMSPKKKILAERNEPVPTSAPSIMEAKSPSIRKVTFAEPLHSSDLKSENGPEPKKFVASFVGFPNEEMHVAAASLSSEELSSEIFDMNDPFNSKNDTESSFGTVAYEPDCVILDPSFKLSPTPTPPLPVSSTFSPLAPLDADPLMPPYDPKTNYLSPRPQFLHYKPKPRMERELGESLMSGSFSDTEVTEDTQSDEGSQKSEEFSSDEVIEEEAGISEPIPAKTSLAEEIVEAREVPKPRSFMKLITIIALLLLFSTVAVVSVSVTNSSVMDHAVFQDFYKVYELSDLPEVAKANLDRFSEFAKAKFDVSARNFHTWYTKSLSSISELISSVRGVHNMGHVQYYNLTVLQELNVVDKEPIFGLGKKIIIEIETPEVYPQVLNNEESDIALESEDYESEFVQQDVGVTSAVTSVPEPAETLEEGGLPTTMIESDQPLQVAEVSEPIHLSEVVVPDDQPKLDEKAADNHSEVFNIGNLAANTAQECDAKVIDEYSDGGLDQQSDIAEIYREAYGDNDIELAEAEGVNVDEYSDVGFEDHGLDSDVAETHSEAIDDDNLELAEEEGESTSIDAAIEDNNGQRIETVDHSPQMVLYLLLSAGTILIAGAAFKWSRKGISRRTRVASTVEPPVYDAKAFHASLPTPKEDHTSLDKPSLRNGPTEIDLHEESCPSEMSSIKKNASYRQKVAKESNEVNSLENKPKKRRESLASSSDYSITPSYGSFTTYDRIKIKNGHGEEETITPVRRSSRVRSKATSPL